MLKNRNNRKKFGEIKEEKWETRHSLLRVVPMKAEYLKQTSEELKGSNTSHKKPNDNPLRTSFAFHQQEKVEKNICFWHRMEKTEINIQFFAPTGTTVERVGLKTKQGHPSLHGPQDVPKSCQGDTTSLLSI